MVEPHKSAMHDSLLNRADMVQPLGRWVNGLVPVEEGGYEGRVSDVISLQTFFNRHHLDVAYQTL